MTAPTETAEKLKPYATSTGKPILASWMGGSEVEPGEAILNRANIPTFGYPDEAARMFNYMWQYADNLRGLYETPILPSDAGDQSARGKADKIIAAVRDSGRTILTEYESKQLLAVYGIPTVETHIALNENDAVKIADDLGYPVVLKLYSETITHKTDVGGVQLNIRNAEAVRQAYRAIETAVGAKHSQENLSATTAPSSSTPFSKNRDLANASPQHFLGVTVQPMVKLDGYELIIGSSVDPQFGPVLLFGSGGQLVEVFKDRALALPPLNTTLARRLMEQTRIHKALKGVRGRQPVDLDALEQLLVRFSQLVVEQKWIKEIDINPLLAAPPSNPPLARGDMGGLLALDARVVIHDKDVPIEKLPRLAIRPYPTRYIKTWTAKNGMPITFRPIRPEDEPLMIKFHESLSDRSVYLRYLQPMLLSKRVAHERLARICFVDYDRELAMVAEGTDPKTGERVIMVAGRLSRLHEAEDARVTVLVNDAYQGMGLGKELLRQLLQMGRNEKIRRVNAVFTPDNAVMRHLCEEFGARFNRIPDGKMVIAEMDL